MCIAKATLIFTCVQVFIVTHRVGHIPNKQSIGKICDYELFIFLCTIIINPCCCNRCVHEQYGRFRTIAKHQLQVYEIQDLVMDKLIFFTMEGMIAIHAVIARTYSMSSYPPVSPVPIPGG